MTGEFLLLKKNTAIISYSTRVLKISKKLNRLSEEAQKFLKKTTYVKYHFKYIHNPQASKCTRELTTSQVFFI